SPLQVTAASDAWKCFLFTAPANGRYALHFTSGSDDVCIREYVEETKDSWVIKAREAGAAGGQLKVDLPAGKRCLILLKDAAEGSSTNVQFTLTAGAMLSDAQIVSLHGDTVDVADILDFLKEGLQIRLTYEGGEEELLSVSDETCRLYDDGPSTGLLFADSRDNRYLLRFGTVTDGNTTWHALSAKPELLAMGSIPAGEVQMMLYDYGEWKAADTGLGRSTADALASQPVTFEMPSAQYELTADEQLSIALPASETAVAAVSVSSSQGNPVFAAEARNGSYTLTIFKKSGAGLTCLGKVTSDFFAQDTRHWLNYANSGEFLAAIKNTGDGDDVMDLRFLKRTRDVWMVSSIPESQHAATLRSILEQVQVKAFYPTTGEETVSCAQFTEIHGGEEGSGSWLKGRLPSGYAAALYLMKDGEPVNLTDLDEMLPGGSYSFRLTLKLKQSIAADPGTWTFYTSYFSIVPEIDEVEIALPSGGTVSMADLTNYWWDNLQVTVSYDNETQETLKGRGPVNLVNHNALYHYYGSDGVMIGIGYEDSYRTRYLLRFSSNYQTEDTGYKNLENGRYPAYNAFLSLYYMEEWLEAEKKGYSALTRLRPIATARIPIDMSAEELSEGTP
ncbi:MAG: hypothetical protein IIY77_00260, partial [Lachnospiraceae bacterium]|nr:hypothetical protein [Lachnospiraceae bacterium]